MTNPNLGQPVKNKHKVPKKQWDKWTNHARRVFNDLFYSLRPSMQFAFLHPAAIAAPKEHWETTRWNVAWIAAEAVNDKKAGRLAGVKPDGNPKARTIKRMPKREKALKAKTLKKRARRGR